MVIRGIKHLYHQERKNMNIDKLTEWVERVKNTILIKLAYSYLGTAVMNRFNLHVKIGNYGSYTKNEDTIMVSVTETKAKQMNLKDLLRVLKFLLYHECSHVLYTDFNKYKECILSACSIFEKEANARGITLYKKAVVEFVQYFMNCIEDGRIENILCNNKPGIIKHRDWYRIKNWMEDTGEQYPNKINSYFDGFNIIATMGIYPKEFSKRAEQSVVDNLKKCESLIGNFVLSNTLTEGKKYTDQMIEIIAPDLVDLFAGLTEEQIKELLEAIKQMAEKNHINSDNYKANEDGTEKPNGPIIGILTDDMKESNESDNTQRPDYIIDLRTKKQEEKKDEQESKENDSNSECPSECENSGNNEKNDTSDTNTPVDEEKPENRQNNGSEGKSDKEQSQKDDNESSKSGSEDSKELKQEDSDGKDLTRSEAESTSGGENTLIDEEKPENRQNSDSEGKSDKKQSQKDDNEFSKSESADLEKEDPDGEDLTRSEAENAFGGEIGNQNKNQKSESLNKDKNENPQVENKQSVEHKLADILSEKKEQIESETDKEVSTDLEKTRKGIELSQRDESSGRYDLTDKDLKKVNEALTDTAFKEIKSETARSRLVKISEQIRIRSQRTKQKLINILKAKETDDRTELYTGSIDVNSLGLFCAGKTNVFKESGILSGIETCCFILKDHSGSMSSDFKENLAIEALAEVEESVKGIMPLKMVAFNENYGVNHHIIKNWDDMEENVSYALSFRANPRGCNNDAYSIYCAAMELMKRPEDNKILIVISDGLPSACKETDVQKAVHFARKNKIFVINFLIGDNQTINANWENFKNMYETYFCGVNPDKLGNSLFSFLKKFVESL